MTEKNSTNQQLEEKTKKKYYNVISRIDLFTICVFQKKFVWKANKCF